MDMESGSRRQPVGRRPSFPFAVLAIFFVNVGVFAYSMYVNNCPAATGVSGRCIFYKKLGRFSFQPLSENPLLGPSTITLERLGALELGAKAGGKWRLLTCSWLHMGAIHLVANMLSLLFIGFRLEQEFGFWRIALLYLLSGLGGSLASAIRHSGDQKSLSVGASGAIFGLLGALLSELIMNWSIYQNKCGEFSTLVTLTIVNLAIGFLPHMDGSAHVGGFVAGFFLGLILLMRPQFGHVSHKFVPPGYQIENKPRHNWCQYLLWITGFICLIVGYLAAFGAVFGVASVNLRYTHTH